MNEVIEKIMNDFDKYYNEIDIWPNFVMTRKEMKLVLEKHLSNKVIIDKEKIEWLIKEWTIAGSISTILGTKNVINDFVADLTDLLDK